MMMGRLVLLCTRLSGRMPSDWYQLPVACIGEGGVALWPFSVGLLLKVVHFFGSLHWLVTLGLVGSPTLSSLFSMRSGLVSGW